MIVLDVTAIRARMLRHYGRLKRESAGNRDSLIHLLAHVAHDQIAPPASACSIPKTTNAADEPSASSALVAILLVVAEDLVDKLDTQTLDRTASTLITRDGRSHDATESPRTSASDAAFGCFAALCERGWTPAQIHATVSTVADHALTLFHQRATSMSRLQDAVFVARFTTALDDLTHAAIAIDSGDPSMRPAHRSRRR